jgi:hypothetical protein
MDDVASILHMTALMRTLTIDENGTAILTDSCPPPKKKRRVRIVMETDHSSDACELQSVPQSSVSKKEGAKTMPPKRTARKSTDAPIEERVVMVHVTSFEKEMNVLPVVDVETVRLVLFQHAGKTYYHDPTKHKLYARIGAKTVGPYVGRWDPRRERICTDVHDSDADN